MGAILFFQSQAYFMPSKGQLKAEGLVKAVANLDSLASVRELRPLLQA